MKNIQQSYDEIPYKSYAHANSSIYKLEGIATFLGLSPVPVNQARILEIGCSSGGNLVTAAIENPNSTFVGIDLSNIQIYFGQQAIKQLELKNLSLYQMDVLELANKFRHNSTPPHEVFQQKFDYIITHGVYSWVPDEVKDAIIYLSSQLLSEEGLAYISYNVYPGWKSKEIVRDLMLISSKNETNPIQKIITSKAALTNYIETIKDIDDQSVPLLCKNAQEVLDNPNDSYVFHEYLEDYNNPCYFEQFIQRVRKYNLDYLIDAAILPSYNIRTQIVEGEDRIAREQINDFLFNRTFRASILTPKANAIKAKDSLNLVFAKTNLDKLEFSGQFTFEDNEIKDITGRAQYPESFTTITKELTENYPNTITTQYLIDKYPELKDMIHDQLLKLIAYASVNFTIHKLEKIKYEVGKSRLKNGYIQYFNYFANEEAPNLMPANMLNDTLKLTPNHARFAVMFDGNNSVDEIIAAVKAYMQEYDLHFTQTQADGTEQKILDTDEIEKTCYAFINEIKSTLELNYFFEYINH